MTAARRPAFLNPTVSKVTAAGNVRRAALSPDGKIVAYVIDEAGKQGLWVRQVAVSNSVRLVPPSDTYYRAITFSRDGTYLYYTVAAKEGAGFELRSTALPALRAFRDRLTPRVAAPLLPRRPFRRPAPATAPGRRRCRSSAAAARARGGR